MQTDPLDPMCSQIVKSIWSYRAVRLAVGLVFISSGVSKLSDPATFAVIIDAYGIVPSGLSFIVAVFLIFLEIAAGMALLLDIRGSLPVLTGLLLVFMAILIYGLQMGLDVDCGCFGADDPEAEAFHGLRSALNRDLVILAGTAYLFIWRYKMNRKSRRLTHIVSIYQKWRKQ